jgi:hypothetical protein
MGVHTEGMYKNKTRVKGVVSFRYVHCNVFISAIFFYP